MTLVTNGVDVGYYLISTFFGFVYRSDTGLSEFPRFPQHPRGADVVTPTATHLPWGHDSPANLTFAPVKQPQASHRPQSC